jgi:hypothetical protein
VGGDLGWNLLELIQFLFKFLPSSLLLLKFLVQGEDVGFIAEFRECNLRNRSQLLAHHRMQRMSRGPANGVLWPFIFMLNSLSVDRCLIVNDVSCHLISLFIVNSCIVWIIFFFIWFLRGCIIHSRCFYQYTACSGPAH